MLTGRKRDDCVALTVEHVRRRPLPASLRTFICVFALKLYSVMSAVPRQNSIRSENGTILSPHSVKSLNSTMSVFEEREASR